MANEACLARVRRQRRAWCLAPRTLCSGVLAVAAAGQDRMTKGMDGALGRRMPEGTRVLPFSYALQPTQAVGRWTLALTGATGRAAIFLFDGLTRIFRAPFRGRLILEHAFFIGNQSLGVILLTASFTGMVLVLQGYTALIRFGGTAYLGPLVALSLLRELGPVLAALMVTARAGSSMAATLGSMRVTEQIDALEAMAVDAKQYLVSPRLVAALIALPLLTGLFSVAGIAAAYTLGTGALGIDGGAFMANIESSVEWSDVSAGLWKSLAFAVLITWIATYFGFNTTRGAAGVGRATTRAVVTASVLILVSDYVLTAFLF